jgi:regulation of enolase protein 1 (concanavalin A-like superfamily)
MWGGQNNARNILVRPAPDSSSGGIQAAVTITNNPGSQYEQVNLVWFYDDSNMVKLGLELVDGKRCIVMGREQEDKTRTIAIVPIESTTVRVRVRVREGHITGEYKLSGASGWQKAGICDLPPSKGKPARLSLHFYQGPADQEHWARVSDFLVETLEP